MCRIIRGYLVLMGICKFRCCCPFSNAIGVNVQVYTTSNIIISIQDRHHKDCCYDNCYDNFISANFLF